jgi:predicted amidohydrolase YtcJ
MVLQFNAAGVSVGTHAIGDRAIDLVVDTYAEALRQNPAVGLRHSLIQQPACSAVSWDM